MIVFRVENVLVKDYDESVMYDRKKKNVMKKVLKMEGVELERKDWEGMKEELEGRRKGFEEEGDVEMKMKMRDLMRRMDEMDGEEEEGKREMRRKFLEESFEKSKIGVRGDLEDLERLKGLVGGMRLVFVSGYGKMRVMRLLRNNGLREFEVMGSLDELELEGVEKEDVVMFGNEVDVEKMGEKEMKCVLGVENMWKEIGIKRVG